MTLLLSDYPQLIANAQVHLAECDLQVLEFSSVVLELENDIDAQVAFETDLKNEAQRKAKKWLLEKECPALSAAKNSLNKAKYLQQQAAIKVELLRNQFCLAKLAEKRAIAELELAVTA